MSTRSNIVLFAAVLSLVIDLSAGNNAVYARSGASAGKTAGVSTQGGTGCKGPACNAKPAATGANTGWNCRSGSRGGGSGIAHC